jgi:hypothetical protein
MITPAEGDYSYVPLNAEGRRAANAWDPARDAAAGEECKGYAAPAIMRLPSRVHITWQGDNTLKLDIDTGMQTRVFHFDLDADRMTMPGRVRTPQNLLVFRAPAPHRRRRTHRITAQAIPKCAGNSNVRKPCIAAEDVETMPAVPRT